MMYASPDPDKQLVGQLTDADLERLGWYILIDGAFRIILSEEPKLNTVRGEVLGADATAVVICDDAGSRA